MHQELYFSVTELEIEQGMAEENAANTIHMYLRDITDVKQYLEEPSATKYVDLKQNIIDQEAQVGFVFLLLRIAVFVATDEKKESLVVRGISQSAKLFLTLKIIFKNKFGYCLRL